MIIYRFDLDYDFSEAGMVYLSYATGFIPGGFTETCSSLETCEPFDSETNSELQIQKAHLETPPPRPSIYNPEIGIKLEKIILMALQKKVEKRFQNARDMIDELHKVRGDMTKAGLTIYPDVTQKIVMPENKGLSFLRTPLKIIAFLALLVAGVFLFIFPPEA